MAIEFHCTNCHSLLQIPDGNEGRQVRCPQCQHVLTAPVSSGTSGGVSPLSGAPGSMPESQGYDASNPYSAGTAVGGEWAASAGPRVEPPWELKPGLKSFFSTLRLSWQAPDRFYRTLIHRGGIVLPLAFMCVSMIIGGLGQSLTAAPLQVVQVAFMANGNIDPAFIVGMLLGVVAVYVVFVPIAQVFSVLFYSGITHLVLMLIKGSGNGWEATLRALAYSTGSLGIFMAIPFCGPYVSSLGMLVLGPWAIARLQDAPLWKGFVGYYSIMVICCVVGGGIVLFFVALSGDIGLLSR